MRTLLQCLSCLLLTSVLMGVEMTHTADTLDQVKTAVSEGKAVLIDVREQNEWDSGHLKAATLVPLSVLEGAGDNIPATIPKDKPVYLHCRSGRRVLSAGKILKEKGYDVRPLSAGYTKLLENGFEKAE